MRKILFCLLTILFLQGTSYGAYNFVDNGDGTVTDARTGLIWLKNAGLYRDSTWYVAVIYCNTLKNGMAGLTDGSTAGQWRLPNIQELEGIGTDPPSMWYNIVGYPPVIWTMPGTPFTGLRSQYWSSTILESNYDYAWSVVLGNGYVLYDYMNNASNRSFWPVRGPVVITTTTTICDVNDWKTLYEQTKAELEECKNPTLVKMSSFEVTPSNKSVNLKWKTESEIDNAGFNVWRADGFIKITPAMIPSKGAVTEGAEYDFLDLDVFNRKQYFYLLEDVDNNGISTFHGPVKAVPKAVYGIGR